MSNSENCYIYRAEVDASNYILKGHFEGMPVVPGVVILTMIKECIAEAMSLPWVTYTSIKECKFLATILPAEHSAVEVHLTLKDEGEISAQVVVDSKKMVKLRAVIAQA
ncbi:MAG: hypothetical protein SNG69_01950 [Rikenellaceae bacterium]